MVSYWAFCFWDGYKKQVAGNCSSPATEDTGIIQKNFKKANKQAQGVINKIFVFQGTYRNRERIRF
ncbi:hypothetical protein A4H97_20590 [Niastella yeongjuensis]|uniref:Uncharacterized protein n=1 Tax=Niastella yeongjuensis TaxID=354355 RepID=A0A1V9FC96_9BACT|nr:hypothetical protein A4H97_20590 [Niastella yeongjuensis]